MTGFCCSVGVLLDRAQAQTVDLAQLEAWHVLEEMTNFFYFVLK